MGFCQAQPICCYGRTPLWSDCNAGCARINYCWNNTPAYWYRDYYCHPRVYAPICTPSLGDIVVGAVALGVLRAIFGR